MSIAHKIVIVEDEAPVRTLLQNVLVHAGMEVKSAADGNTGLQIVRDWEPDLVLLDHGLQEGPSGLEVCRLLRSEPATAQLPILVLTGELSEDVELKFLEAGADDYIRKSPRFKSAVLVGRINAVLRRTRPSGPEVVQTENLTMHPGRREALVDGRPLKLTPTEFDILYKLATNPDRALRRRELLDRGEKDAEGVDRTVDVHVLSIRRKLGAKDWLVSTVWGVGYRLGSAPET
jgi:two-component system phosphate regulon response regulator PhoB